MCLGKRGKRFLHLYFFLVLGTVSEHTEHCLQQPFPGHFTDRN